MEKAFIGIDPSFRGTGLVIINGEGEEGIIQKTLISSLDAKIIPEKRIITIGESIIDEIHKFHNLSIEKIYIEGMFIGKNRKKAAQSGGLQYYIRILLLKHAIPYEVIPPTRLKKFVTGKGNAGKDVILMKILRKWKIELENHNLGDAYGLARMAYEEHKGQKSTIQKATQVVRRVVRRVQYNPDI